MFLPKSKYKGPFTATGGDEELLVKSTLKPYRGEYIITYKNQYFNGATPQEAKYELILKKVHLEKEENKNKHKGPQQTFIVPSEADYKNKYFDRHFAKDLRSKKIVEITLKESNRLKKVPGNITVSLQWFLEGPAKDTEYRGYIYYGAETRNRKSVSEATKVMKGLDTFLKDLGEFVK